jgi:hypothetical protein
MSGVIFEKMDWRVGGATNGLIILEKTGKSELVAWRVHGLDMSKRIDGDSRVVPSQSSLRVSH